jgi:hypothetical protein
MMEYQLSNGTLLISSVLSGTSLCTSIPLFILAGSKAQFDIPMKATYKMINWILFKLIVKVLQS